MLLRKERSYAEVYNDLDDHIVALFRVLQDEKKTARLIKLLHLTPFSRSEFNLSYEPTEDQIEIARRLIIRAYMGFGSNAHASTARGHRSTGFRANSNRRGTTPAHDWASYPDCLASIVERFRGCVIEHREAKLVMATHDAPETLHYVDPPYLPETRSPANKYDLKFRMYRHELTVAAHVDLLRFLREVSGMVVLSGYAAPLYDEALPDWHRVTCETYADGARPRTEVLWLNPAANRALNVDDRAGSLFADIGDGRDAE